MEGMALGAAVTLFAPTACADSGDQASPAPFGLAGLTLTGLAFACGAGGGRVRMVTAPSVTTLLRPREGDVASIARKTAVRAGPWPPGARGSWMGGCLAGLLREDLGVRASRSPVRSFACSGRRTVGSVGAKGER